MIFSGGGGGCLHLYYKDGRKRHLLQLYHGEWTITVVDLF